MGETLLIFFTSVFLDGVLESSSREDQGYGFGRGDVTTVLW